MAQGHAPSCLPRALAALVALGLAAATTPGCGETSRRLVRAEDVHHPSASRRLEGVHAIRRARDPSRVPELIELLDDPDDAVRLSAGVTLTELTGRDTGYAAWADPAERRLQVEDWRRWWASARGAGAPAAGGSSTPPPPPPPPSPPGGRP